MNRVSSKFNRVKGRMSLEEREMDFKSRRDGWSRGERGRAGLWRRRLVTGSDQIRSYFSVEGGPSSSGRQSLLDTHISWRIERSQAVWAHNTQEGTAGSDVAAQELAIELNILQ
ncbi:hypothetical protein RRG08_036091 [Elysia crispata]|uniref:Uncharacterized protein n=1 Tax=Elysia crispata TaxID=231223 RepID=A0AAE1ALF0_9GAST|nr:hypothetical protein RRG08_036091 [Elysia crispata]